MLLRGYQLSVGVPKIIFFFYPFLKPLQISFKFRLNPPLIEKVVGGGGGGGGEGRGGGGVGPRLIELLGYLIEWLGSREENMDVNSWI